MNAANYSDLMNWIGTILILLIIAVSYTIIRVRGKLCHCTNQRV